ncbi:hypothetical protein FF1_042301 [Malus domestica]|uniref:Protein kinase domain-containing protein n=1 Tax=Malus domestica TaxID=3750 RepID=A0A498J8I6_MALDO|nr:hypothetical protein DVH24_020040 [Malus domestica]
MRSWWSTGAPAMSSCCQVLTRGGANCLAVCCWTRIPNAKIGDFGLARLKTEVDDQGEHGGSFGGGRARGGGGGERERGKEKRDGDDNGSILEESVSLNVVTGGLEEGRSPECCVVRIGDSVRRGRNGVLLSEYNSRRRKYNVDRK